ncbi:MAG: hypothetical protein V2J62_01705 [candidate division KSB1 bacterium]|nr:hypothetical protein [candidate division KSB1 bacterium]
MEIDSTVLVLTNDVESNILITLSKLGVDPAIRTEMGTVLRDVHHKRAKMIFMDLNNCDDDALEFVLNVRDIDQHLPVIIVDGSMEGRRHVSEQANVFLISNARHEIENIACQLL